MIRDVTLVKLDAAPESTVARIKKMREVARKAWLARYAVEPDDDIKLEDIAF